MKLTGALQHGLLDNRFGALGESGANKNRVGGLRETASPVLFTNLILNFQSCLSHMESQSQLFRRQ